MAGGPCIMLWPHGDLDMVRFLIARGANLKLTDDQGFIPAQFARREHFREIADYIDAVDGAKHPCTPKHKHKHGPGPA